MENLDCYALVNNQCIALKETNCLKCSFYRNDIKLQDIEKDINAYPLKNFRKET